MDIGIRLDGQEIARALRQLSERVNTLDCRWVLDDPSLRLPVWLHPFINRAYGDSCLTQTVEIANQTRLERWDVPRQYSKLICERRIQDDESLIECEFGVIPGRPGGHEKRVLLSVSLVTRHLLQHHRRSGQLEVFSMKCGAETPHVRFIEGEHPTDLIQWEDPLWTLHKTLK